MFSRRAYAVFIQEVLINPVVFDELVGNSFDQGSVCTWTNRNPLIHARCNSIVVHRVNHDGLRMAFIFSAFELIAFSAAGAACD